MSFFDSLGGSLASKRDLFLIGYVDDKDNIEFLQHVQATQKKIGNAKQGETVAPSALGEK